MDGGTATFSYDLNGNQTAGDGRTITFDLMDRVASVTQTASLTATAFAYAPDGAHYRQLVSGGAEAGKYGPKTVYYVDKAYELSVWTDGTTEERIYVGSAVIYRKNGAREVRYQHLDRLGSLDAVTADDAAATELLQDAHGFDPWGKPRAREWTWSADRLHPAGDLPAKAVTTDRGFTGHEHLDVHWLIHMNGRVYDYRLGRFLSVDPIISNPANPQSVNPYSNIGNNPLSGTDPTGYMALADAHYDDDVYFGASVTVGASNGATSRSPSSGSAVDAESPTSVAKDTNWVAVAAGAAYGTVQGLVPGGVLAGSPAPNNADFEGGRGAALQAVGTVQVAVGGAEIVGGGTAAAAGVATAPTGAGVAVAGGGAAVVVDGAVKVVQGTVNIAVGQQVSAHAQEMRAAAGGGGPKTAKEMGQELAAEAGTNRVSGTTAGGKKVDIDLQGKGHFDKALGKKIDTPHVHESKVNRGPDGKISTSDKTTRPATKADIRTARKLKEKEEK